MRVITRKSIASLERGTYIGDVGVDHAVDLSVCCKVDAPETFHQLCHEACSRGEKRVRWRGNGQDRHGTQAHSDHSLPCDLASGACTDITQTFFSSPPLTPPNHGRTLTHLPTPSSPVVSPLTTPATHTALTCSPTPQSRLGGQAHRRNSVRPRTVMAPPAAYLRGHVYAWV